LAEVTAHPSRCRLELIGVRAAIPLKAVNNVRLRDDLFQKTGKLELRLIHCVGVVVVGRHSVLQLVDLPLHVQPGRSRRTSSGPSA
jgi:hypothetical protein